MGMTVFHESSAKKTAAGSARAPVNSPFRLLCAGPATLNCWRCLRAVRILGSFLKRLPGIGEILGRARIKMYSLQLFCSALGITESKTLSKRQ